MDEISRVITSQRDPLAEDVLTHLYQQSPEHRSGVEERREKSLQDIRYHLDYLSQAISTSSPALFTDYVRRRASWLA